MSSIFFIGTLSIVIFVTIALGAVVKHSVFFRPGNYLATCTRFRPCNTTRNLACDLPKFRCTCANSSDPRFVYTYSSSEQSCVQIPEYQWRGYLHCNEVIEGIDEQFGHGPGLGLCRSDAECQNGHGIPHSRCNLGSCECECKSHEGGKLIKLGKSGTCVLSKKYGETCDEGNECDTENNAICYKPQGINSSSIPGLCGCEEDYIWSSKREKCILIASKCEVDEQCNAGSAYGKGALCDLVTKSCVCPDGTEMQRHKCVSIAETGAGLQQVVLQSGKIPNARSDEIFRGTWSAVSYFVVACILVVPFICALGYCFFKGSNLNLKGTDKAPLLSLSVVDGRDCRLPQITMSDFTIDYNMKLGDGKGGIVYGGQLGLAPLATPVAIKTLNPACQRMDMYLDSMYREIEIFKWLPDHENVIKLLAYSYNSSGAPHLRRSDCFILMELCAGSLRDFLIQNSYYSAQLQTYVNNNETEIVGHYSDEDLLDFSYQIASGAEFLAEQGVIHGDLACRNVLLDSNRVAKITDFGLAHKVDETPIYIKTTIGFVPWKWSPPEVLTENRFSVQSDVWSFGVTLWEIYSRGSVPYNGVAYSESFAGDLHRGIRRLPKPELASMELYRLMKKCWESEPARRIGFQELKVRLGHLINLRRIESCEGGRVEQHNGEVKYQIGPDGYLLQDVTPTHGA